MILDENQYYTIKLNCRKFPLGYQLQRLNLSLLGLEVANRLWYQ